MQLPERLTYRAALIIGCLSLLLGACLLSLMIGARPIAPADVFEAIFSRQFGNPNHDPIWDGRIPRTLLAVLAGAGLGISGALMQGLTRNPLADPGVMGVNAGAAFFVVLAVGFFGVSSAFGYIWFALAGALIVSIAVYLIGSGGKAIDPVRLALAGVALTAVLTGVGEGLALLQPQAFDRLRSWMLGNLDIRSLEPIVAIAPFIVIGLVLALLSGKGLNAIALGEEMAASLGINVARTRLFVVAAITLLAGSATAAAGVMVFVGLMVPHVARRLCGPNNLWIMIISAFLGPILLLIADTLGRVLLPGELPAGIVAAFIGAPFLIFLARRKRVAAL